jgi:predicted transglutaminase-like protease
MKLSITVDVVVVVIAVAIVVTIIDDVLVAAAIAAVDFLIIIFYAITSAVMATVHTTSFSSVAVNVIIVIRIHFVTIVRLPILLCYSLSISSLSESVPQRSH